MVVAVWTKGSEAVYYIALETNLFIFNMLAIAIKITWLMTVSVETICVAIYRPSKNHQNAWIYLMTTFPYNKSRLNFTLTGLLYKCKLRNERQSRNESIFITH